MKNAHNKTNTALKIVHPSASEKERTIKVKSVQSTSRREPSAIDNAAELIRVSKDEFLSARKNLRKNASILRTAANLLQLAGLFGEALFLVVGGLLYGFLTMGMNAPDAIAIMATIGMGIAGLTFGLVCISFGTCLSGVADSVATETKKLFCTK